MPGWLSHEAWCLTKHCPVVCPGACVRTPCPAVPGGVRRPAGAIGSVRELRPYAVSGVLCPAVRRRDA
eukprot:305899-Alexandrium_andersonii.AAC.1